MPEWEEGLDYDFEMLTAVSAFEYTGNALFAWFALRKALSENYPIPQLISEHFIWVADKLLSLGVSNDTAKPVRDAVLGIPSGGRGTPLSDFPRHWPRILFTHEVLMELKGKIRGRKGTDASFAIEAVDEYQMNGLQSEKTQLTAFEKIGPKYGFNVEQATKHFNEWRSFWEGEKVLNPLA